MIAKIVIISTTPGMTKRCHEYLALHHNEQIPIYDCTMSSALEKARNCIKDGTRVIISRGGTAEYLRENLSIPIVDIGHTFLSVFLNVQKLHQNYQSIAMIAYRLACDVVKQYNEITKDRIMVFEVTSEDEFTKKFQDARNKEADVIIGGFQIAEICKKHAFPYHSTEPDDSEIGRALHEALHSLRIEEERTHQYSLITTILNSTTEGIVGVDPKGYVFQINRIARTLLDYHEPCQIDKLMPAKLILDTITTGCNFSNELITVNGTELVCGCQAIVVGKEVHGAVLSLQEGTTIRNIDSQIRKKLLGRGHIARKDFSDVIGASSAIKEARKIAERYSKAGGTVLISGETGTGKELFAQGIHNHSNRRHEAFVAINCAALPQDVLESELFGYVRGAFTGARSEGKAGLFELAHKGTVFLDEIAEISLTVQVKLLRVLQEMEVTRIGDDRVIPIDVRILAASNKDLQTEVSSKRFREDLYYRVCVLELYIPPLRERCEDIPGLVRHFLQDRKVLTGQAEEIMKRYTWPGNVRQLSNIAERLNVLCDNSVIEDSDVRKVLRLPAVEGPERIFCGSSGTSDTSGHRHSAQISVASGTMLLPKLETQLIQDTLERVHGDRGMAASILGISKTTLWRRLKK
ncbi:MAG: sigma 54-interacting transcriptional regulator [Spirochaetota bacterium]